jgi:hypothetical protein
MCVHLLGLLGHVSLSSKVLDEEYAYKVKDIKELGRWSRFVKPITGKVRVSFEKAFGISVGCQLACEKYYSTLRFADIDPTPMLPEPPLLMAGSGDTILRRTLEKSSHVRW